LAVVQVAPEDPFQNAIHDIIGTALDELRVIVEELAYGLLQANLACENGRRFLNDGHDFLLQDRSRWTVDRLQNPGFEVNEMGFIAPAELFVDFRAGNPASRPSAVEMLEPGASEALPGGIAKDQIAFGDRLVLTELPGLSDREVAQQVVGGA